MYTKTEVDNLIPSITPNPSTTTGVLNGLEIDGTAYEIQGTGEPNVQADWDEVDSTADDYIKNKPSLATVATSGSYNDLSNKPTIPDISTKVSKSGDTMTGCLIVKATGAAGSYDEGIRINAGKNGYATLCIGGAENSTTGTSEGQFWIGTNPTNNSYKRKLYIAQNGSTQSGTYFEAGSSSVTSPSLHMGNTISMNGSDIHLNTNGSSSNDTSDIVWWYGNGREKARLWCNDSYTSESGLNFRMFNSSGNQLFTGTIPLRDHTYSVGNGTLTLQRNGSTIASFTANQSGNTTANFTDTNDAVKQTNCGTNNWNLRVLLSGAQDDTERTSSVYKAQDLQYNPNWKALYIGSNNRTWGMVYAQGNQQLNLSASAEENYRLFLGVRESTWSLAPLYNQYLKLGTGSFKWNQIYSSSATINTSDRRKKKDIQPLDENARIFVMKLNPVSYKMKDGETGRTHYGMIAQDIEDELTELGMTAMDFAGFCKDEVYENVKTTKEGFTEVKTIKKPGEYIYGLRYEEFIAPLIKTVQLQQQEIEELKHRIDILEGK